MSAPIRMAAALLLLSVAGAPRPAQAAAKFYFQIRGVTAPKGVKPALQAKAKQLFEEELAKHPEVVTTIGNPMPQGADLERALKQRSLEGFGVVLRVEKVEHRLQPPAAGKVYQMLMVQVQVAIDAEKIPSGQMALAGEGSEEVGTEVKRVKEQERDQLALEALTGAIRQAVEKSMIKLTAPPPKASPKKARRKKR